MIVVVDTNVLLSAALRDRLPERVVLFVATQPNIQWLVTPDILREYVEVLKRPKFQLDEAVLAQWTELIESWTLLFENPPRDVNFPRDPRDAPFLAAALASQADYLITGDRDLLDARGSLACRVVTVAEFAAEFRVEDVP